MPSAEQPTYQLEQGGSESFLAGDPNVEHASWALAYQVAFPVADYADYAGNPSPRGIGFHATWPVIKALRLGFSIQYSRFYDEVPRETYELDGGAINAALYRHTEVFDMAALAQWRFLKASSVIRPYVGVELGVAFLTATTLVADLAFQYAPTGFLLVPEAGVTVRLTDDLQTFFAVRYNFTTASFSQVNSASYIALQLGLMWESNH